MIHQIDTIHFATTQQAHYKERYEQLKAKGLYDQEYFYVKNQYNYWTKQLKTLTDSMTNNESAKNATIWKR